MLGIGTSTAKNPIVNDPGAAVSGGLIGWWDFTKIEHMTQNVDRSSPVTTNGQYIGTITNLAPGTATDFPGSDDVVDTTAGGKLGEFLRARTDTGTASNWKPVYTTGGVNGLSYASFPSSGEVVLSAGIFGNLDSGENNASWGGSNGAGAFNSLKFFGKQQTIIIVEQIGTDNITSANAMYQVRGMHCPNPTNPSPDYWKTVINTQKVASETYNTYMGSNATAGANEITATSTTFANTNLRCIVSNLTDTGGGGDGQGRIYVNGTLEDTETLDDIKSNPADGDYYGFDMTRTQVPGSGTSSFAQVSIGAEVNDQYLSASSFGINHYYGKIYEVIHYAKSLSSSEMVSIEQYISLKYGITFS